MIEEFSAENNSFPFIELNSDTEMLDFLRSQKDEFKFLNIRLKVDIDLYEILSGHKIEGVSQLIRPKTEARPNILKEIDPVINFSYVQFDKKVSFFNCELNIHTEFKNVVFNRGLDIRHSHFFKGLEIFDTTSKGSTTIGVKSKNSVLLMRSSFDTIEDYHPGIEIDGNLHIEQTTIKSSLDLTKSKIKGQFNVQNSRISGSILLKDASIGAFNLGQKTDDINTSMEIQDLDISNTTFSAQMQICNININGSLKASRAVFNDFSFFTNVQFFGNVYFDYAIFHKSQHFELSSAEKNFSFYNATINSQMYFHEMDFTIANLSFTGCQINANLWIGNLLHKEPVTFKGKLSFQGATISSTSIVRIFNLNHSHSPMGEIDFSNSLIRGFLDIRNVYINKITFDGALVLGNIQDNNSLLRAIKDRSTARILKHEARRVNNTISALSYNKIEMKLYSKTMKFRTISNWSILRLNYISNNYGADWLWGVLFTISGGLLFYSCFNMAAYGVGFIWAKNYNFILNDTSFWMGFINYCWLPHGFTDLISDNEVKGGAWGAIFFIFGKILIAYGLYQTVAAFRKYV